MLFHEPWTLLLVIITALVMDRLLGELWLYHPLVGFGRLLAALERGLAYSTASPRLQYALGSLALAVAVLPILALVTWLESQLIWAQVVAVLVLYLVLGLRNLLEHGQQIATSLARDDLAAARDGLGLLCSCNTVALDRNKVINLTVETLLEQGARTVLGALIWFLLAGASGLVLYTLTLAAAQQWGSRGAFARPAQLLSHGGEYVVGFVTVLLFGMQGGVIKVWRVAVAQARNWSNPAMGLVIAAGASTLQLRMEVNTRFDRLGSIPQQLGEGPVVRITDIQRVLRLLQRTVYSIVWLTAAVSLSVILYFFI